MQITGNLLIGGGTRRGTNGTFHGTDAATGQALEGTFGGATMADLEETAHLAWAAFQTYRATTQQARAAFLDAIAQSILDLGDELVVRCMAETGLPRGRIEGERARTVGQLRLFASVVRDGSYLELRIDPALPDRTPLPRPDLRLRKIPLGPVAVFGASNFPLAFSVAGGDTASALAAGCPVIVKAHPAHPGTSELVGLAIQAAVRACGLPAGVFALLHDSGKEIAQALVADPRVRAVGFTGSRGGGTALAAIAAQRRQPIPVYAEMSSVNPVILFPAALQARGHAIGKAFIGSLTLGVGQFCTNPGLIFALGGAGLDAFLDGAKEVLTTAAAGTMLTGGICEAYGRGVDRLSAHPGVSLVGRGLGGAERQGQAALFLTSASAFLADHRLQDEVFGPASLVVQCENEAELEQALHKLEGQLTAAIHIDAADHEAAGRLVPVLEDLAGRILVNGFGTGVEVAPAMVHGGPYPATSDGRSTSVGTLAIDRFLRPVCYQDFPQPLLPEVLHDGNPLGIARVQVS